MKKVRLRRPHRPTLVMAVIWITSPIWVLMIGQENLRRKITNYFHQENDP